MTAAVITPTPQQIATLDPCVDFDAAYAAGVTFTHRRKHIQSFACPRKRCPARAGESCTTPNGWLAAGGAHKERADLAYGRTKPVKPRKHRLTDRQAQWLEGIAENESHRWHATDKYAQFSGDAADRATADAMERGGLIHQVGEERGERIFELTVEGWRLYWTHRLVIRRGTPPGHPATCPCKATEPAATA
jgi:hypothetical protein